MCIATEERDGNTKEGDNYDKARNPNGYVFREKNIKIGNTGLVPFPGYLLQLILNCQI